MPRQPQTTEQLIDLIRQGVVFGGGTVLEAPEGIEQMAGVLQNNIHPDFVTVMVSDTAPPRESRGIDGFKELLTDWVSPYEAFRLEIEEVIVKDDKLVFLARQVATTKHGGVEVETESASVWWLKDGQVSQAVFYLDQRSALQAAGVDPDRPPSG
jgi:ketosteroid isomerase-like protein